MAGPSGFHLGFPYANGGEKTHQNQGNKIHCKRGSPTPDPSSPAVSRKDSPPGPPWTPAQRLSPSSSTFLSRPPAPRSSTSALVTLLRGILAGHVLQSPHYCDSTILEPVQDLSLGLQIDFAGPAMGYLLVPPPFFSPPLPTSSSSSMPSSLPRESGSGQVSSWLLSSQGYLPFHSSRFRRVTSTTLAPLCPAPDLVVIIPLYPLSWLSPSSALPQSLPGNQKE